MVKILFVRELKYSELEALEKGKNSKNIFSKRRCQILMASAEGKKSSQIAKDLNCSAQTVRNAIAAFNENGLASIQQITRSKLIPPLSKSIQQADRQKEKGKLDKAISIYRKAIALYPSSDWSYHYLGEILIKQGNFEEAITCYQKAIEINPTGSEYYNKLGEIYFKQRQLDKAVDIFKKAISLAPNSAWYHQNLGEALAQKHQWGTAVNCYRHALKLNPDEVLRYHNSLEIEPDDPNVIEVNNPVFIVGCGHSGTSIMLAILSSHPAFYPITYESALFKRSESEIRKIMLQWDRECIEAGKKRWIEKTPPHIFQIKRFSLHRPQSQFIIMLRDGRDVVCSLKHRQQFKTVESRVERWIYDNLAGLPYWNDPRVKVVKYENLIENTQKTLEEICEFLGEKYTNKILEYHQNTKHWYSSEITKPEKIETHEDHLNLRNWQINQPLFDGRGKWKTEMNEVEKEIFKKNAQQYLVKFGYVNNYDW
jgi:tetratricopeptide (TPR) repeat protein